MSSGSGASFNISALLALQGRIGEENKCLDHSVLVLKTSKPTTGKILMLLLWFILVNSGQIYPEW